MCRDPTGLPVTGPTGLPVTSVTGYQDGQKFGLGTPLMSCSLGIYLLVVATTMTLNSPYLPSGAGVVGRQQRQDWILQVGEG